MEKTYRTFEDHVELLTEKGYLDSNFKSPGQLGEWLQEFRETIEYAASQAALNNGSSTFMMPLQGKFNGGLDTVTFNFQYQYTLETPTDPEYLRLLSLRSHMQKGDVTYTGAKVRKTYRPANPADLVSPAEVYARLSGSEDLAENPALWIRLYRQFQQDRNPANDPQPDPKQDPYNDPKDKYEYDPEAEVDRFNTSKFVRKPREEFKPDKGVQTGVPTRLANRLPQPAPPKPPIPKNIRR